MYTRSQTSETLLDESVGVAVGSTSVFVTVGETRVGVADGGTGVMVIICSSGVVAAAGALHPTNNIPVMSTKYLIFITHPLYLAVN
jgi:hypothetical protein